MKFVITLIASLLVVLTVNATEVRQFDNAQQQQLYHQLINELRCPKCQNQTIADSNAPLAKDLRDRTAEMVQAGQSRQQIIDYMVARYGDFVHYQPPLTLATSVLWWGPAVIVLIGLATIVVLVRRQRRIAADETPLSDAERQRLAQLKRTAEEHSDDR
ncbi:cytochrome c-type biogenesis protein [Idiomarina xiamenensis]|uniref:Cytochrome c-type biogenesis protein n=1 Tax=Idiomarina xiamenensis 10-D-4 TaxID=740709 RepID=K2KDN6_9GAMM|nr:cytochrome c-type biogenesis protein [Idiomarina xiamenensis]EKE80804.1 cytochrome c-type biogenesis protein CcmH [Idiomarina xiamenensis 10-D-4]